MWAIKNFFGIDNYRWQQGSPPKREKKGLAVELNIQIYSIIHVTLEGRVSHRTQ